MQLIVYRGWPLALAEPQQAYFHPALGALAERDRSDPLVRFACALGLHAFELHAGLIEGPFDQARAEHYARELLIPADHFARVVELGDVELADMFGVRSSRSGRGAPNSDVQATAAIRRDDRRVVGPPRGNAKSEQEQQPCVQRSACPVSRTIVR